VPEAVLQPVGFRQAWIVQGRERLAPVRALQPSGSDDGSLFVHTTEAVEPVLLAGGGLVIANDAGYGERYAAQALSCEHHHDGLHLLASSLGEVHTEQEPDEDDDYLAVAGREPATLGGLIVSQTHCPRGLHVRVELDRAKWERWGIRLAENPAPVCRCGRARTENRWQFSPLIEKTQRFRVVRLRQRRTLEVTLDVAMLRNDRTVGIGHLVATQTWAKP